MKPVESQLRRIWIAPVAWGAVGEPCRCSVADARPPTACAAGAERERQIGQRNDASEPGEAGRSRSCGGAGAGQLGDRGVELAAAVNGAAGLAVRGGDQAEPPGVGGAGALAVLALPEVIGRGYRAQAARAVILAVEARGDLGVAVVEDRQVSGAREHLAKAEPVERAALGIDVAMEMDVDLVDRAPGDALEAA